MSLLGFDKLFPKVQTMQEKFLRQGIQLAQEEFRENFDSESNAETRSKWDKVKRKMPPPILIDRGVLKDQAIKSGNVRIIFTNRAILTIDPLDKIGRGYAQYHQDGSSKVPERAFVTQSDRLSTRQEKLLDILTDELFS